MSHPNVKSNTSPVDPWQAQHTDQNAQRSEPRCISMPTPKVTHTSEQQVRIKQQRCYRPTHSTCLEASISLHYYLYQASITSLPMVVHHHELVPQSQSPQSSQDTRDRIRPRGVDIRTTFLGHRALCRSPRTAYPELWTAAISVAPCACPPGGS